MNNMVSDYSLKKSDLVKVDLDCIYRDYYSDIGRTIVVGNPSELILTYYHACKSGLDKMKEKMRPGISVADIYTETIETVRQNGISHYRLSNLGHSIGTSCYDGICINPNDSSVIEEGMVLNIEPSYYELGFGAIHLEDTVYINKDGCESLQKQKHKLYIIE